MKRGDTTGSMARRANKDCADTFDLIVRASTQVLRDEGATELSLRRVAAEANLSLGTVQYYFPTKSKLIETCLAQEAESLTATLASARHAIAAGAVLSDILPAAVRALYQSGVRAPEARRLRVMQTLVSPTLSVDAPGPFLLRELGELAAFVSENSKLTQGQARLLIVSVAILVTRFSTYDTAALRVLLDLKDNDAVHEAVEDHLDQLSRLLLGSVESAGGLPSR